VCELFDPRAEVLDVAEEPEGALEDGLGHAGKQRPAGRHPGIPATRTPAWLCDLDLIAEFVRFLLAGSGNGRLP
jgi:hypothetical protein